MHVRVCVRVCVSQGKLLRRVMAPGTPMLSGLEGVVEGGAASGEAGRDAERCAMQMRTQLLSAWQVRHTHTHTHTHTDVVIGTYMHRSAGRLDIETPLRPDHACVRVCVCHHAYVCVCLCVRVCVSHRLLSRTSLQSWMGTL